MTALRAFLGRHQRLALDTSVFIHQIELNPRYVHLTDEIFRWLERPNHSAVASTVTMMELLVAPYRDRNKTLVNQYYALLTTYPHLEWSEPSLAIADIAAQLRAWHRLKPPDALFAATAIAGGATALITNDAALERVRVFETAILDRLI